MAFSGLLAIIKLKTFKKILFSSIILVILCIGILLHPSFNGTNRYINYLHSIAYDDKLEVNCSDELTSDKVKLVFENELALIENRNPEEAKIIEERSRTQKIIRQVIFENGKQIRNIPYDYGKQRIIVFYDNDKIGEFGHWRTNDYHVHDYIVNLKIENNKITLSGGIYGPDQMNKYLKNDY